MLFGREPERPMDYRAQLEDLRWAVDEDAMQSDPNRLITSRNPSPDAPRR